MARKGQSYGGGEEIQPDPRPRFVCIFPSVLGPVFDLSPLLIPGAERIVYELLITYPEELSKKQRKTLRKNNVERKIISEDLVAKESLREEEHSTMQKQFAFHKQFAETQILASELAEMFNERVKHLDGHCKLEFIEPRLIRCDSGQERLTFLVEPNLRNQEAREKDYGWQKWNSNDGAVNVGKYGTDAPCLDTGGSSNTRFDVLQEQVCDLEDAVCSDFLQAFSHFTYATTERELLVCDLQGIFDIEKRLFRLTDPVIHDVTYIKSQDRTDEDGWGVKKRSEAAAEEPDEASGGADSPSSRPKRRGRTDRGQTGIYDFFKSHRCNPVCKLLHLEDNFDFCSWC